MACRWSLAKKKLSTKIPITSHFHFSQVPRDPERPCELCYCIKNTTACVMQECTLKVQGCEPIFQEGVCCPVSYMCGMSPSGNHFLKKQRAVIIAYFSRWNYTAWFAGIQPVKHRVSEHHDKAARRLRAKRPVLFRWGVNRKRGPL